VQDLDTDKIIEFLELKIQALQRAVEALREHQNLEQLIAEKPSKRSLAMKKSWSKRREHEQGESDN
jgi:hypothetical protein